MVRIHLGFTPTFTPFTFFRIVPSFENNPSLKRNLGAKASRRNILAFLDDDAYPQRNWLEYALVNFSDPEVVAVGGPAVTPAQDNLRQQASGRATAEQQAVALEVVAQSGLLGQQRVEPFADVVGALVIDARQHQV